MLFEVLLRQAYLNKNVLNRWHYSSSGTPAAVSLSFALASAFGGVPDEITNEFPADTIMNTLANIQHTALAYVELQVQALYSVSDFYTIPYASGQNGLTGGTAMSTFYAYALQSNRVRTDVRRGNKRLAGVSETYVGTGGVIESSIVDALDTLAEQMSAVLTYDDEGNTLSFTPAVLSFDEYTAPSGKPAYRPYPTLAEQLDHAALGVVWQAKPNATTQNTRKPK